MLCFSNCESLKTLNLYCNLPVYSNYNTSAFYNCSNIQNITFGSNVTNIGKNNLHKLSSLKNCTFNGNIPSFEFSISALDEIHFNGTLKEWMSIAKNIVTKCGGYNLYINDVELTDLDITDEEITEIPEYAFYKCKSLNKFFMRTDKLETIGKYAFYECSELWNINLKEGIKTIGDLAFYGCTILNKDNGGMNIPSTIENFGKHIFYGCSNLNDVRVKCKLPEASNENDSVFYGAEINIIAFEQDIPAYALYNHQELKYVSMTSTVTKIGDYAFYNCKNLQLLKPDPEFFLPIGLESIGNYSFQKCSSLTAITLPRTITSIGKNAFDSCTNLETINLKCNMPSFAKNTEAPFTGCEKLENLYISEKSDYTMVNVTTIGDYAFYNTNLKEIEFPSSVKYFGTSSFNSCSSLKTIILHSVPERISQNAFRYVSGELKFTSPTTLDFFNKAVYYEDPDTSKTRNLQGSVYIDDYSYKIEETLGKVINTTYIRLR